MDEGHVLTALITAGATLVARWIAARFGFLRAQLDVSADWPRQMMSRIAQLEADQKAEGERLDNVERENAECQRKYAVLEAEHRRLTVENDAQTRAIRDLSEELNAERARSSALKRELDALRAELGR